jgi:hypothetical protein
MAFVACDSPCLAAAQPKSFGRFDEILYLIEKTSTLTLPDLSLYDSRTMCFSSIPPTLHDLRRFDVAHVESVFDAFVSRGSSTKLGRTARSDWVRFCSTAIPAARALSWRGRFGFRRLIWRYLSNLGGNVFILRFACFSNFPTDSHSP